MFLLPRFSQCPLLPSFTVYLLPRSRHPLCCHHLYPPPETHWQWGEELHRANFLSAAQHWHSFNYCWDRGGRQGLSELKSGSVFFSRCPRGWQRGIWYLSYSIASIWASADSWRLAFFVAVQRDLVTIWPEYWTLIFPFILAHWHTHLNQ